MSHNEQQTIFIIAMSGLIMTSMLMLFVMLDIATSPTPAQINKCVETTNYSKERCVLELTK